MCRTCAPEGFTPRQTKKSMLAALGVCKLYETHTDGGMLESLTNDWKVSDDNLAHLDTLELDEDERSLLNIFKALTVPMRLSALWFSEEDETAPVAESLN